MWSTRFARVVMPFGIAAAMVQGATAQDTVKVGMVMPLTGTLADAGKQVVAGARLYMSQHGDAVAGKHIDLIVKDAGSSFETGKRLIQEAIVNDKVDILGIGITPTALALAPVVTEVKKVALIMSSGASITTTKSPYFVRAGFLLSSQSWIMAEWAAKNGSKRVVTLVNDWAPGVEAETAFKTRFLQVGGEVIAEVFA